MRSSSCATAALTSTPSQVGSPPGDWPAGPPICEPATFVAFDVLELDGRALADQPYAARREALVGLGLDGPRWTTTMADGDGEAMWAATRDLGLEGVVAKDPRSAWVPRRSRRWLKCKHWRYGTFTVVGWAASTAKEPGGLVLGAPGAVGELRVVGVAPLNVDRDTRAIVMGLIDGLRTDQVPLFAPRWRRPVQWIRPELRAGGAVPGAHPDRDVAPRLGPAGGPDARARLSVSAAAGSRGRM